MTTRYNAKPQLRFNVPGLPSGYQSKSETKDFTLPPVGIEDVDKALFSLFEKEIPFAVGGDSTDLKKVPVIFAAGEKWALNKRMRAIRDRNNTLVLPLITGVRTQVLQQFETDIAGRGINQQTGEIIIQRQLDATDRAYQQLVNRLNVQHQQNLAVKAGTGDPLQLTTLRETGDLSTDPVVEQGGLLVPDRMNNVWETIVVPAPQFFTAQYEITFWTQYTRHMNQLLEQLVASFLPQGNCWRLDTPKGYWFVASVDANTYTSETNIDDFHDEERIIKYKFTVNVPGYVLATATPGSPVPLKRYLSCPSITFTAAVPQEFDEPGGEDNPFLGADDPTLPLDPNDDAPSKRRDQRNVAGTRLYPGQKSNPDDPALGQLARGTKPAQFQRVLVKDGRGNQSAKFLRVKSQNLFTGETVLDASDVDLGALSVVVNDD